MTWILIYNRRGILTIGSPFSSEKEAIERAKIIAETYEIAVEVAKITKRIHSEKEVSE